MTEQKTEKRHIADSEVERVPWREFVRNQFRKITGFVVLLAILVVIINLSNIISPDPNQSNPDNIISLSTINHIMLIILSSILFLSVMAIFTKIVLIDHKEEFGITHWKQRRVIVTFLLTTSFLSLVYILLDVALIRIYLFTLPTLIVWNTQFIIPQLDLVISDNIDRLSYSQIRGYIFVVLLLFMFIFPLSMFVNILTRYGRRTIKERRERQSKLPMSRLILGLIASIALAGSAYYLFNSINNEIVAAAALFVMLGFVLVAAIFAMFIIFNILRFGVFLTYSNILLIFPFIFLFYLLPGGLWAMWDVIVVLTTGGIDNTIYTTGIPEGVSINPTTHDMSQLPKSWYLEFYIQTLILNLRPTSLIRLIQLDFIIVVGLSAVVIGFAEGYSILAIFRSIAKGVSIAKTGRVAARSPPKMIVITSRLFYLAAWLSFFWDNLVVLSQSLVLFFNISLPTVDLPQVLSFVVDFSIGLGDVSSYFLVLTILAVPFYFILTSSFKFLSVSLVLEKVRDDKQYYYLLISSAFILIVTNIFADIAALPVFFEQERDYLPLAGAATSTFLPFVAKIFEFLEALGFYAGVIYIFVEVFRKRVMRGDPVDGGISDDSKESETELLSETEKNTGEDDEEVVSEDEI